MDLDYYALKMQQLREDTVYRKADLLAPFDRELELERQKRQRMAKACQPVARAGTVLAAVGRRLTAIGERLAPPHRDHPQPSA